MTVHELIARLQAMPPDAEVLTEGCDCTGDSNDVTLETDGRVMICRQDQTPSSPGYYDKKEKP